MKTITIASQKGGCGKSTLAIHLAVVAQQDGMETIIADLDPHSQTSAEWGSERESEKPAVVAAHAEDIPELQLQAADEGFGLLILDCPPFVDDVVEMATQQADFTLLPAQPSFADVRTLPRVIGKVHPPYGVVLSVCTPGYMGQESSKTREVRELLEETDIPVAGPTVTRREAFKDALNGGEAVVEYDPKGKASKEIRALWAWIQEQW